MSRNNYSATAVKDIKYTLRQCSYNDTSYYLFASFLPIIVSCFAKLYALGMVCVCVSVRFFLHSISSLRRCAQKSVFVYCTFYRSCGVYCQFQVNSFSRLIYLTTRNVYNRHYMKCFEPRHCIISLFFLNWCVRFSTQEKGRLKLLRQSFSCSSVVITIAFAIGVHF